jgi:hypothetical protein
MAHLEVDYLELWIFRCGIRLKFSTFRFVPRAPRGGRSVGRAGGNRRMVGGLNTFAARSPPPRGMNRGMWSDHRQNVVFKPMPAARQQRVRTIPVEEVYEEIYQPLQRRPTRPMARVSLTSFPTSAENPGFCADLSQSPLRPTVLIRPKMFFKPPESVHVGQKGKHLAVHVCSQTSCCS